MTRVEEMLCFQNLICFQVKLMNHDKKLDIKYQQYPIMSVPVMHTDTQVNFAFVYNFLSLYISK